MELIERVLAYLEGRWNIPRQALAYLVSGGFVAAVELAVLYVLTDFFKIWYLASLFIAFWISLILSFLLQKFWTFQDSGTERLHIQGPSYLGVALLDLAVNSAVLYVMVERFHIWYVLGQVANYVIIAVMNFTLYKFVIFRKKHGFKAGNPEGPTVV